LQVLKNFVVRNFKRF